MASLDYAVNRSYSSGQGRFTTVDPIGVASSSLGSPQSLNLYGYVQNNPIDFVDPSGLNAAPYDPFGIAYYVDGILSDARTAWAHINGGGGYISSYSTSAITAISTFSDWGHVGNDRFGYRRVSQQVHVWQDYLPLPTETDIVGRLEHNSGDCEKYLNSILVQMGKTQTIRELYNLMKNNKIIAVANLVQPAFVVGSSPTPLAGRYDPNKDIIEVNQKVSDKAYNFSRSQAYMSTIFHELIHKAGGDENHKNMAEAASRLAGLNGKLPGKKKGETDSQRNSRYFNDEMDKHCYTTDEESYKK